MTNEHTLTSQHWQMRLPSDWKVVPDHLEGALYYASADESKGMYIGTWQFDDDPRTPEQMLAHVQSLQLKENSETEEGHWNVLSAESGQSGGIHTLTMDSYDESNKYRVLLRVLVQLPIVVRAAFHHYYCEDLSESSEYFAPIISSLRLVDARPGV